VCNSSADQPEEIDRGGGGPVRVILTVFELYAIELNLLISELGL